MPQGLRTGGAFDQAFSGSASRITDLPGVSSPRRKQGSCDRREDSAQTSGFSPPIGGRHPPIVGYRHGRLVARWTARLHSLEAGRAPGSRESTRSHSSRQGIRVHGLWRL